MHTTVLLLYVPRCGIAKLPYGAVRDTTFVRASCRLELECTHPYDSFPPPRTNKTADDDGESSPPGEATCMSEPVFEHAMR